MHIVPTRLLEDGITTANYDLKGKLCEGSQGLDWGDDKEIIEAVADVKDDKDKVEDPREKNRRLKREKMRQKHLSKANKKACLKIKKANNDEKAGDDKNVGDDKDTNLLAPVDAASPSLSAPVAAFFGFLIPVAITLSLLIPVATSPGPLTSSSVNSSPASAMGASIAICPSLLSFFV